MPGGQSIVSGWNATYSPAAGQVTARDLACNAAIPANGSTTIGFPANHTGDTAEPGSCALNGAACTVSGGCPGRAGGAGRRAPARRHRRRRATVPGPRSPG
ncbi:cellulose binding domain-containing protein [Micromonospora auratinigra]|uniref:cellulose binding domain-containing protein n=1 Tax=Micromonospora auratinigra TaxID=261654 RepID=UPI0022B21F06|nr:cellulose binding domain-containing protein [Micromonospora auratinigra]